MSSLRVGRGRATRKGGGKGGGAADAESVRSAPEEAAAALDGGLSRNHLLVCSDLIPNAKHLKHLNLSGHGPLMGPFVATEIGRALHKSNRSITYLDLSGSNLQSRSHNHRLTECLVIAHGCACNGGCDNRAFRGFSAHKACRECDLDFCRSYIDPLPHAVELRGAGGGGRGEGVWG